MSNVEKLEQVNILYDKGTSFKELDKIIDFLESDFKRVKEESNNTITFTKWLTFQTNFK